MAIYTKAQLYKALRAHCNTCNDVHGGWHAGNDCTGVSCEIYPIRPGDGPGHLEQMKTHQKSNPASMAALKVARDRKKQGAPSLHGVREKGSNSARRAKDGLCSA